MDDVRRRNVGRWLALFINKKRKTNTKSKAVATANGAFKQTYKHTHDYKSAQLYPTRIALLSNFNFYYQKK